MGHIKAFSQYIGPAIRLTVFSLVTIIVTIAYFSAIKQAHGALLKSDVVLRADVITLGDIFDGIEQHQNAGYILGPAPQPGKNIILTAATLNHIAHTFNLPWNAHSGYEQVVISSSATKITAETIRQTIMEELNNRGFKPGNFDVFFTTRIPDITLPGVYDVSVLQLDQVEIDRRNNSFYAKLRSPDYSGQERFTTITGHIKALVEVPVLKTRLNRGDIIRAADIHMEKISQAEISNDMILDKNELIGMTPRRVLVEGQTIRFSDVKQPNLVKRGERVTMQFNYNGMRLTALGKALENGARDDMIRVVNLSSNKTVQAMVTGTDIVQVNP